MTASRSEGLLAIAVALSHLGCSDGRTMSQGTTVAVQPPAADVQYAGTVDFQAAVTGAIDTGVLWSVREVGGGSVSTGGLYTAPSAAGTFHVVAVSRAEPTAQGDASVTVVPLSTFTPNLTLDATTTSQTIDGMGTNINVESWRGGELTPALDLLVDVDGVSLLRVARDPMDWVHDEALIPKLHALDPATLTSVYEAPPMQDLWSTLAYLNGKGLRGAQLAVSFMGWTPTWAGGSGAYGQVSAVTPAKNQSVATMIASLVYYGRAVKGLDFTVLAPFNEPDWNGLEGPQIGASQLATLYGLIAGELDLMGQTAVRLAGPDVSSGVSGAGSYVTAIRGNATASARTDHYTFHTYSGATSPGASYAARDWWLTETSVWCGSCDQNGAPGGGEWSFASDNGDLLIQNLLNGLPAVLVWEGYDSFWYHHDSYSTWGLLAYSTSTGKYAARKRFYVNAQVTRFVRPGMKRVAVTAPAGVLAAGFVDAARGKIAVVGHNTGTAAVTVRGQLAGAPTVASLALYQTDSGAKSLTREADVAVLDGTFTVTVPADTFFSLSN